MEAGNARYNSASDIPDVVPVFPLSAALLLPGGRMPLNIFEPRYLQMIDHAIGGDRLVGMIQPRLDQSRLDQPGRDGEETSSLCNVGCIGRITSFAETGDGRYLMSLHGVCRFRVLEELPVRTAFRQCRIAPFGADLAEDREASKVDRASLLRVFRAYLEANELEADWDSVKRADTGTLVNALSMMSPYGPAEKQALLEAPDLKTRAETLIAITEMALARGRDEAGTSLQ